MSKLEIVPEPGNYASFEAYSSEDYLPAVWNHGVMNGESVVLDSIEIYKPASVYRHSF